MLRSVFSKTLWDQRLSLAAWAVGITGIGVLYAVFYPSVNTPEMKAALESYPKALIDALGFNEIATAAGYLGAATFGMLTPALIIVMAAAVGGSAIAGEEENGRLDLTLAHPVSRWSVLLQRYAALIVSMLVVSAALGLALVAIAEPAELGEIGTANLAAASLHLAVLGIFFGGLALGLGAATGRRSVVYLAMAVVALVGYFGNNLGPTIEGLHWLRDISPFHFYQGGLPLRNGIQLADLAVLAGASALLVIAGGLAFDRRDVAV
jgi:ABC-2 type transport system permease protein